MPIRSPVWTAIRTGLVVRWFAGRVAVSDATVSPVLPEKRTTLNLALVKASLPVVNDQDVITPGAGAR